MGEAKRRKDKGMYHRMPECDDCRSTFEVERMPGGGSLCGFCSQLRALREDNRK